MGTSDMLRFILALILAAFTTAATAQPLTTKPSFTNMLTANCAASNVLIGGATSPGCGPTPTRAGDLMYFNGTAWVSLAGNNSGTQLLQETAAGVPSWVTVSGTGTVTSVICGTGLDGGTFTSSGTCSLSAARRTGQTIQKFLTASSSGTYTTPANVTSIDIIMVGAGGGGEGSGTSHGNGGAGGNTCWNTSGAACTSPVYQAGGGSGGGGTQGGGGGTVSGSGTCDMAIPGGSGASVAGGATSAPGGSGGNSALGGGAAGGAPGVPGQNAAANTGGGAGGASINGGTGPGSGGGAGAYCAVHISAPAVTYTWATGAGGTAGTAGTSGLAAGIGGAPGIWVRENYNIN
jgi:hypothetical protein